MTQGDHSSGQGGPRWGAIIPVLAIAVGFAQAGVADIVALRGDPPKGTNGFRAHPEGFANSVELIGALADAGNFAIRVGAYPDKHPEAADSQADIY